MKTRWFRTNEKDANIYGCSQAARQQTLTLSSEGSNPSIRAMIIYLEVHIMNFRTKEHYEIRIAKLKAKGEVMNEKLINKAKRELKKFN